MKTPTAVLWAAVLCVVFFPTVLSAQSETVIAEGVAAITGNNLAVARDKAIDDALRKAVEQAVGTMVSSDTLTERYRVIHDKVIAQTAGYVRRYSVLSEKTAESLYRVKVKAEVNRANLTADLRALKLLQVLKEKPKVMVLITEQVGGLFATTAWENVGQAEATIMEKLLAAGFNVVDPKQTKLNIDRDMALRLFEGDTGASQLEGLKQSAQVIIAGKSFSKFSQKKLLNTNLQSIQATLQARAYSADTGRVISSRSATGSTAHIDEMQGGAIAIKKAGEKLAAAMIEDILAYWQGEVYGRSSEITLMISGIVSYRHLMAIKQSLEKEIQGVRAVHQRAYTSGIAELMIDYGGKSTNIADALAQMEFNGFRPDPTNVQPNRVDLKVVLLE